jgi:hypothetical protein
MKRFVLGALSGIAIVAAIASVIGAIYVTVLDPSNTVMAFGGGMLVALYGAWRMNYGARWTLAVGTTVAITGLGAYALFLCGVPSNACVVAFVSFFVLLAAIVFVALIRSGAADPYDD